MEHQRFDVLQKGLCRVYEIRTGRVFFMGRTSIESVVWTDGRLDLLAERMGWDEYKALGVMARIWGCSQDREIITCTETHLKSWLKFRDGTDVEKLAEACCEAEFFDHEDAKNYFIRGNKKHIAAKKKYSESGKKGGKNSGRSRRESKRKGAEANTRSNPSKKNEATLEPNTIHYSSIQDSTIQDSTSKTVGHSPSSFALDLGSRWLAFGLEQLPHYAKKWNQEIFARGIDDLIRKGPISEEKLEQVFEFASQDPFWARLISSPAALLKKSERNGLRKIDNILAQLPQQQESMIDYLRKRDERNNQNDKPVPSLAL